MSRWNRKIKIKHTELILAFAICDQLCKDILAAWKTMQEYPEGTEPWYTWQEKTKTLVDETQSPLITWYASCCSFDFKTRLKKMSSYREAGGFDYEEWCKY